MTDDLQPLRFLLAQTEKERDVALADLLRAEAAQRGAEAQAEQLVAYRREYEQRWSAEFCREGKIELVRCYQGFVERLSQAVEQQQCIAAQSTAHADSTRLVVRGHELRAAGLKKLIERRLLDAQQAASRGEQRQSDEHAARAAWAKRAALGRTLPPT